MTARRIYKTVLERLALLPAATLLGGLYTKVPTDLMDAPSRRCVPTSRQSSVGSLPVLPYMVWA